MCGYWVVGSVLGKEVICLSSASSDSRLVRVSGAFYIYDIIHKNIVYGANLQSWRPRDN